VVNLNAFRGLRFILFACICKPVDLDLIVKHAIFICFRAPNDNKSMAASISYIVPQRNKSNEGEIIVLQVKHPDYFSTKKKER
jgi:hypothetical protein